MKHTDKIENKSYKTYFKSNDAEILGENFKKLLKEYCSIREAQITRLSNAKDNLFNNDNIQNKINNKNSKDFRKKLNEYNQLIDVFAELDFKYEIIDFQTEVFDTIIKMNNEVIGIEITQLITQNHLKEFYESTNKVIQRVKTKIPHQNSLIKLNLNEKLYYQNKNSFLKKLESEIEVLLRNLQSKNFEAIQNHEFQEVEKGVFHIYMDNYPSVNVRINRTLISAILKKKDVKLSKKLKTARELEDISKWLLVYCEGYFYDDYIKIEHDAFQQLSTNNFNKMIFYNRKKSDLIIVDFK